MDNTLFDKLRLSFEQSYHQVVKEMQRIKKNVYLVQTERDNFVLKCFFTYSSISWQEKCIAQMITKGAKGLVPFIKNKNEKGVNHIAEEKLYYAVMPFIPGKSIDYADINQVKDCISLLGQFHAYGSGLYGKEQRIPFQSQVYQRWLSRVQEFERSLQELEQQKREVDGLLPFVKEYGENALEWAYSAINHFPQAYMLYLEEQAQLDRQIAHLDVAPHNFLTLGHRQYYLLDYDLVDYFPPLIDLIQFINRVLAYHSWSVELVNQLIQNYEIHFPLADLQKKYMPIFLIYPHDFFREWLGLWKRKQGYHPEKVHHYFQQLEREWANRGKFVEHCLSVLQ